MPEFFRGWKRKTGVATLEIACVFVARWIRSGIYSDGTHFSVWFTTRIVIGSAEQSIALGTMPADDWGIPEFFSNIDEPFHQIVDWDWQWCGFGSGHVPSGAYLWVLPYWSIVVPLTLLSGYLLLSRPSLQTTQPVPHA